MCVNLKALSPWSANLHLYFQDQILSTLFPHYHSSFPLPKPSGLFPQLYWVFVLSFDYFCLFVFAFFFFFSCFVTGALPQLALLRCAALESIVACSSFLWPRPSRAEDPKANQYFSPTFHNAECTTILSLWATNSLGWSGFVIHKVAPFTFGWGRKFILQIFFFSFPHRRRHDFVKVMPVFNMEKERRVRYDIRTVLPFCK